MTVAPTITDADRLAKLWDAYRAQEEELHEARTSAARLSRELEERGIHVHEREVAIVEKQREIQRLHDVITEKDARIAELVGIEDEVKAIDAYKHRITELEAAYAQEKERLAKLFLLYEEATTRQ